MKEDYNYKTGKNNSSRLLKSTIIGFVVGILLGVFLYVAKFGHLPFGNEPSMGLGDMSKLMTIIFLYFIAAGACLGIVSGFIIGTIIDYKNK